MNLADLGLFVFIIAMLLFGIKKGFVKMVIDLLSNILSFIFAVFFARTIATAVQDFSIFDGMKKCIQEFFTHNADLASKNVTQTINGLALPDFIKRYVLKDFPNPSQTINSGATILAERVFHLMLLAIVCIALIIIIRVGFYFIDVAIEKFLEKIEILSMVNKFLGGILGVANGLLIVYIALAIIALLASRMPDITSSVVTSSVLSKLYNNNLLLMILT